MLHKTLKLNLAAWLSFNNMKRSYKSHINRRNVELMMRSCWNEIINSPNHLNVLCCPIIFDYFIVAFYKIAREEENRLIASAKLFFINVLECAQIAWQWIFPLSICAHFMEQFCEWAFYWEVIVVCLQLRLRIAPKYKCGFAARSHEEFFMN